MCDESEGSEMETESDRAQEGWNTVRKKKRSLDSPPIIKKKTKTLSREEINAVVIGISDKENATKSDLTNKNQTLNKNLTKNINYSARMHEMKQKPYINLFYINTKATQTRIQMADIWANERPTNNDIILKTKKGFLLKSNTPKTILNNSLKKLKTQELITDFTETNSLVNSPQKSNTIQKSFSCVIASVEPEISDDQISKHISDLDIEHRYCRRIIAKATNKPSSYIRIITASISAYEKLLNDGLYYKCKHYSIYPSTPPPPAPLPCSKCLEFTHTSENCSTPPKCTKCGEKHSTNKCKSSLPPKCNACGAEDHQAWSFKCSKRPTKPIEGIPNIPIKHLNKKSNEITDPQKKNTKIHNAVTIHDIIINTYVNKLNKPKNTNREELLLKLRKRFITDYNIDTSVSFFSGNRIYILMFDMESTEAASPTEPILGDNNVQVHI